MPIVYRLPIPRLVVALVAALPAMVGCTNFDISNRIPWELGDPAQSKQPIKVAAMWTDTVLNQAGRPSTRGFGGRLMFHATEGGKPVKVQGSLVVYAFDETNRDPNNAVPDRKFVFTADQFAKHYSKSNMGHSYSVWLPWDEVGGEQKEISLIVRFLPQHGPAVVAEQSKHLLPGRQTPKPEGETPAPPLATAAAPPGGVQQATYLAPAGAQPSMPAQQPYQTDYPMQAMPPGQPQLTAGQMMAPLATGPLDSAALAQQAMLAQRAAAGMQSDGSNPAVSMPDDGARRRMTTTTITMPGGPGHGQPFAVARGTSLPRAVRDVSTETLSPGTLPAGALATTATASSAEAANRPQAQRLAAPWVGQSSVRYGPSRSRALGGPIAPLNRDHAQLRPHLVAQQSGLPSPLQPDSKPESAPSAY